MNRALRQTPIDPGFAIVLKPWRARPKMANFLGDESLDWAVESNHDGVDSTSF
jgi:hypothetical protein